MPDEPKKLPQKLNELRDLLNEIGLGWLLTKVIRTCIDKLGFVDLADKVAEVVDAAVDDYFTSKASEWSGLEGKFRGMAKDWAAKTMAELDRWAR